MQSGPRRARHRRRRFAPTSRMRAASRSSSRIRSSLSRETRQRWRRGVMSAKLSHFLSLRVVNHTWVVGESADPARRLPLPRACRTECADNAGKQVSCARNESLLPAQRSRSFTAARAAIPGTTRPTRPGASRSASRRSRRNGRRRSSARGRRRADQRPSHDCQHRAAAVVLPVESAHGVPQRPM